MIHNDTNFMMGVWLVLAAAALLGCVIGSIQSYYHTKYPKDIRDHDYFNWGI